MVKDFVQVTLCTLHADIHTGMYIVHVQVSKGEGVVIFLKVGGGSFFYNRLCLLLIWSCKQLPALSSCNQSVQWVNFMHWLSETLSKENPPNLKLSSLLLSICNI